MDNQNTKVKQKAGRKGDPRMNRAVTVKLKNPELTSYQALIAGGFDFPNIEENDKSSTYSLQDSDGGMLGQRKNQLSRRLKEAKQKAKLNLQGTATSVAPSSVTNDKMNIPRKSTMGIGGSSFSTEKIYTKTTNTPIVSQTLSNRSSIQFNKVAKNLDKKPEAASFPPETYTSYLLQRLEKSDSFTVPKLPSMGNTSSILNLSDAIDEDASKPSQMQNDQMLQKAMDIFDFDIHNYLAGIMREAGYPDSSTTEKSDEYLAFLAKATSLQIERFSNLKSNQCSYSNNKIAKKS